MSSNKFQNLKVNSDVKSSRFVIDLKKDLEQNNNIKEVKKRSIETRVEERLEKIAEIDYKGALKKGKDKSGAYFSSIKKTLKSEIFSLPKISLNVKKDHEKKSKLSASPVAHSNSYLIFLSNQLTLIGLGKLLYIVLKKVFILFYKICYAAGWVIMFILRLVYFFVLAIIKPIIKIVKPLFFKSQVALSGTLHALPTGYHLTQSVTLAASAKLLHGFKTRAKEKRENTESFRTEPIYNTKFALLKPVLVFAGILLIIILPVKAFTYYKVIDDAKGKVLGASESAIDDLISAGQSALGLNFNQAGQGFENASNNFLNAQNELEKINGLIFSIASILPDKNMQLAAASKNILRAGEASANAGKNLSLAMESIFSYKENSTNSILENLSLHGHNAINNLTELDEALNQIDSEVIPEDYQNQFILLKQKTGELKRGLAEFINLTDSLGDFLGASMDKRYLLVFQNNSELRASGGFIGSFALIDFSKGEIKNIEVPGGGSYDTEAGFLKKIKAPEPLGLVRADWHFWDANWWPDWPTSASKLAWFYENSDGSTVDGVISFTPTVIENLLKIIGPIDLKDKYGLVIDADNFWLETQKLAEQKPDITKEPKKIIGDLMNKIIEELPKRLNKDNLVPLFKTIEKSLASKNILFYFTDESLEAKVDDLGWSGRIKNTTGDYLNVINSNIAGGKSDRKVKQQIIHQAEVQLDGSIIDNLIIRRAHEAVNRELFSGVRNVDWLRIYVPLGSELLEVSGFKPVDKIFFDKEIAGLTDDPEVLASEGQAQTDESSGTKIYNEFNKTVFANWSQLDPGETIEIKIKYKLPFKLTDKKQPASQEFANQLLEKFGSILNPREKNLYSYSLLVQKQPGMNSSTIESELRLGDNFKSIWKYPNNLNSNLNGWSITEDLNQDEIMAIMAEEK